MLSRDRINKQLEYLIRLESQIKDSQYLENDTLSIAEEHLDSSQVPASGKPDADGAVRVLLALYSLMIVGACACHDGMTSILLEKLVALSSNIWAWSEFLLAEDIHDGPYGDILVGSVSPAYVVLPTLSAVCAIQAVNERLQTSSSAPETIGFYWLAGETLTGHRHILTRVLTFLIPYDSHLGADIRPLLRAADGRYRVIVRALLSHLRRELESSAPSMTQFTQCFMLAKGFLTCSDHRMRQAILASRTIRQVTECIPYLNQRPSSKDALVVQALDAAYSFLAKACVENVESVLQVLKLGLLEAIFDSATFAEEVDANSTLALDAGKLLAIFEPYTVYCSVLRTLTRRTRHWCPPTRIPSGMQSDWPRFTDLVQHRHEAQLLFDAPHSRTCSFCKQEHSQDGKHMKKCSGCANPRYCSISCQKKDWPTHREECLQYQKQLLDEPMQLPPRDEMFILKLASMELHQRSDEIADLLLNQHPTTPIYDLFFCLHWETMSSDLLVQSATKLGVASSLAVSPPGRREHLANVSVTFHLGSKLMRIDGMMSPPLRILDARGLHPCETRAASSCPLERAVQREISSESEI